METRVSVLEARFDAILPTLATKVDVEQLRREIVESRLEHAKTRDDLHVDSAKTRDDLHVEIAKTRDELHVEIAKTRDELHVEIAKTRDELHVEIAKTRDELHVEIAKTRADLHADIHALEIKMDARFDAQSADMQRMYASALRWMVATLLTIIVSQSALIVSVLRFTHS
jgi:hypothetical protein